VTSWGKVYDGESRAAEGEVRAIGGHVVPDPGVVWTAMPLKRIHALKIV